MSYNYQTQFNSPNYTSGNDGRQYIVIHWWDDPSKNPSYEGVISHFENPNSQVSAHFVATGTDRRVACMVSPDDTAWHAGNWDANRVSIGIECDPRCRDEDYDVVADLICNIRSAYGDLPLKRHGDIVNTSCPGNWDLARLDALARTKVDGGDWGLTNSILQPVPTTPISPVITTKNEKVVTTIPFAKTSINDNTKTGTSITTVGVNGSRTIVYTITLKDGIETARSVSSDVTIPPVDEVTTIGTYVTPDPIKPGDTGVSKTWIEKIISAIIKFIKGIFNKENK